MPTTYELINSATVGAGGSSTISFTSIPQTFTDLVIKASLRGSTPTTTFAVQVNGTTVTSVMRFYGSGTSVASDSFNEHYIDPSNYTADTFGNTELYFSHYRGNLMMSYLVDSVGENNAALAYMNFGSNSTGSSSAITSISLIRTDGNFVQHSTANLYGISNA